MKELKNQDAYKIMTYQCQKCGYTEKIWNSRNAVSPFSVGCPKDDCDGISYHINWANDYRNPNYKLKNGQRYFANYTMERAEEVVDQFIERFRDEFESEEEIEEYRLKQIHSLLHGDCSMDLLIYQLEKEK